MRCLVLWVLISYFSLVMALSNEDLNDFQIPDFTDYDDVPDNNYSVFKNKLKRDEDDEEPLTPIVQNLEKLQKTTTMYSVETEINKGFQMVSTAKDTNNRVTSDALLSEEQTDVLYTETVRTKYILEKTIDSMSVTTRNLISAMQKTSNPEPAINNFYVAAGYINDWQPPVTYYDNTTFQTEDIDLENVERVYSKSVARQAKKPTYDYNRTLDIPALVDMLNYVAKDYENRFNLIHKFNETLRRYKVPTCEPLPTTTPPTTINFNDAHLVAKCFVCGLKDEGIPRSSACADAFSGDFIPLVKIDPKARGQIASFRKYCRFLDVSNYMESPEEPQSLFGRFTGGCSVRWVDLTGVYSQRACRNRRRAVTGKHFASKRMAKLEMTLSELENGCVISPMATLLPVTRGISLYARFHACVCTGSWCNGAVQLQHSLTNYMLLYFFFLQISSDVCSSLLRKTIEYIYQQKLTKPFIGLKIC